MKTITRLMFALAASAGHCAMLRSAGPRQRPLVQLRQGKWHCIGLPVLFVPSVFRM